jgi:hypothetical protein
LYSGGLHLERVMSCPTTEQLSQRTQVHIVYTIASVGDNEYCPDIPEAQSHMRPCSLLWSGLPNHPNVVLITELLQIAKICKHSKSVVALKQLMWRATLPSTWADMLTI